MDDILWTEPALEDLEEIGSFLAGHNRQAAEHAVRRIVESVAALSYHPRMGRVGRVAETRELVVRGTRYLVVYRLRERIEVVAVLHGARLWPDQFEA